MICGHRWYGPRKDVPEAYAQHVCALLPGHQEPHHCSCGADE
jgi:hypothetical protein